MKIDKKIIKKVLLAYYKVIAEEIYANQLDVSDFTDNELVDMTYEILKRDL